MEALTQSPLNHTHIGIAVVYIVTVVTMLVLDFVWLQAWYNEEHSE